MADFEIDITPQPAFQISFATVGPQGPAGTGGGGSITTANILYVDANGNNGTALPDRIDLPYLTPLAAEAAAAAGDTIRVRPGSYSGGTLGSKAGINWFWEPGSSYTNLSNDATVWNLAAGIHNIAGYGRFFQTVGNSGRVFASSATASGFFQCSYAEARGACLTTLGSMIVRVTHARSVVYDVALPSPNNASDIIDIEIGVVDAGGDAVSFEGLATTTTPVTVRIGNIINCGGYIVNEESFVAQKGFVWVGTTARPGESQVMQSIPGSTIHLMLGEYLHPSSDLTAQAANNRITVLKDIVGLAPISPGTILGNALGIDFLPQALSPATARSVIGALGVNDPGLGPAYAIALG